MSQQFFEAVLKALKTVDPKTKCDHVDELFETAGKIDSAYTEVENSDEPGRPAKPELVPPRKLVQRKLHTQEGQAAMVHAIAHIEFNAINLALDAAYRFRGLPSQYYLDWLKIAKEEAKHFLLLLDHLESLGFTYGDFPAHNGLWDLAVATGYDVLARMALVPRIMEARGLDVSPMIMEKFKSVGNNNMVDILEIIFDDEIGHVKIGNHWFHYLCKERALEPMAAFKEYLKRHVKGQIKLPFHKAARLEAGFDSFELAMLETLATA